MELAGIVLAAVAACIAVASCWICARSAPTELLSGFDALQTQVRVVNAEVEELRAGWNRKTAEFEGLIEELLNTHDKVERSRKSIAARQSKQESNGPTTPEELKTALLHQARSQGIPL